MRSNPPFERVHGSRAPLRSSPSLKGIQTMAIKATFSPTPGNLSVFGDDHKNAITVSRNPAGALLVNGGGVKVDGGQETVANTAEIDVFGQVGDDTIALDESNGPLPSAELFGGAGN